MADIVRAYPARPSVIGLQTQKFVDVMVHNKGTTNMSSSMNIVPCTQYRMLMNVIGFVSDGTKIEIYKTTITPYYNDGVYEYSLPFSISGETITIYLEFYEPSKGIQILICRSSGSHSFPLIVITELVADFN